MGKTIPKAVTAIGFLAAGALLVAAIANRHVTREHFMARLDERRVELGALLARDPAEDPGRASRLAAAFSVGQRVLALSKGSDGDVDSQGVPAFMVGVKSRPMHRYRLHVLLQNLEIQRAVDELSGEPTADHAAIAKGRTAQEGLALLCTGLGFYIFQGAERGDAIQVMDGMETMLRLAEDLLATREPELVRLGTDAMILALTSPSENKFRQMGLPAPGRRLPYMKLAIANLLRVVRSEGDRARLMAAMENAEAWLPTSRGRMILDFQWSMERMLRDAGEEHPGATEFPYACLQDLEALIEWQNAALERMPAPPNGGAVGNHTPMEVWRRALPKRARAAAGSSWPSVVAHSDTKWAVTRAMRWIAAGKVP